MRRAELPDLPKSLKVRRVDDGRQRRFHGDVAVDLIPAAPLPGARDVEEISADGGGSGSSGGCDGRGSSGTIGSSGGSLGEEWGPRRTGEEVQLPLGRGGPLLRHLIARFQNVGTGRMSLYCWRSSASPSREKSTTSRASRVSRVEQVYKHSQIEYVLGINLNSEIRG